MRPRIVIAAAAVACSLVAPPGVSAPPTAFDHLRHIVELSPAPEYRRAGAPGMAAVAGYLDQALVQAGYTVVRQDFTFRRWAVDYAAGHEPLLERVDDGMRFKTESAFNLGATTSASGVTCTVRAAADVGPGDCGFIPFGDASPEWKNSPFVTVGSALNDIAAAGGAGAIVQGDVARDLVFAQSVRVALPTVVAVAHASELIGREVRLRAMGTFVANAPGRNVLGVLRPPSGQTEYAVLLAHADGWFQAAADNGSGTAAILRAAELLAATRPGIGVVVGFMDAEEVGLIGAERFVEALSSPAGLAVGDGGEPIRIDDVKAVINLDASSARASDVQNAVKGIARQDLPVFQWRAMVVSEELTLATAGIARFAARGVLGLPVTAAVFGPVGSGSLNGRLRSDVHHFATHGIPFVWPVSGYPEYHTDGDLLSTVDPADLEALAFATADLTHDIATLPIGRVAGPFVPAAASGPLPPLLEQALHAHLEHEH